MPLIPKKLRGTLKGTYSAIFDQLTFAQQREVLNMVAMGWSKEDAIEEVIGARSPTT